MLDAQGLLFFIAGYETTANTLQSVVYFLAKNPDVQDQLHEEVVNTCESSNKINHDTITVWKYIIFYNRFMRILLVTIFTVFLGIIPLVSFNKKYFLVWVLSKESIIRGKVL